ncbi:PREDICTED: protein lifeguard 2 [Crocodylus porosus]|uniref:protein lifeguard 2 n=1 Tax=Gavialis gangeticus TaxID=94835 RepID=UPI00092EC137|nr:PREDICTED: protein lifeguard 2 [Gavialis gangeticus]XP_019412020.1 PREDICTED: protein lifeguard 2 [Crocodylus porosus]
MTQGKLSVNNKPPNSNGQEDKRDNAVAPSAPPSYEEATSGEGMKAGAYPTPPSVPLHPSWAYVDPSTSPSYGSGGYPGDTEMLTTFSWDDRNVRRVFIRKVYAILMVQLLVTVNIVAFFTFCDPVKDYIQTHPAWYWASYAVFFVTYMILACCSGPRRYFPWNLILLSIFTLSMSYLTGMLSSYYDTKSVLLCLGITALVCLSVTIFSFQTKYDFTSCQGVLFVMLMVLVFGGIIMAVILPFQYVPWLHAIYAVLGAILFTMFLAFDMQMLMGNRRYALSPEEYIFGALNIYLDIIYIFSFLLQFFGSSQE